MEHCSTLCKNDVWSFHGCIARKKWFESDTHRHWNQCWPGLFHNGNKLGKYRKRASTCDIWVNSVCRSTEYSPDRSLTWRSHMWFSRATVSIVNREKAAKNYWFRSIEGKNFVILKYYLYFCKTCCCCRLALKTDNFSEVLGAAMLNL